ncbi:hypothetical protein OAZ24_01810 [Synechococcus sp. AH-736-G21]|nr:hypothetical protein [Synechococcus sp. AH-736-G21]
MVTEFPRLYISFRRSDTQLINSVVVATFAVLALVALKFGELLFYGSHKGLNSFPVKQFFCMPASMIAISLWRLKRGRIHQLECRSTV